VTIIIYLVFRFHCALYEVVFKVKHDGFYFDVSTRFPSFKMCFWCNSYQEVIEIVVENPDEYRLVSNEINTHRPTEIIEESSDQQKVYMIVKRCSCGEDNPIRVQIGALDILHIFPSIVENGWEYHRVIVFRHEDFEELIKRLSEKGFVFKILRKVPFDGFIASSLTLTADTLLSRLTEKQVDAFLTAHKHGYYKLPRNADIKTIAIKENVPRTTFHEHLKRAENNIAEALVPYIALFKHTSSEQRRRMKIN
jgi:predicted DNA binding protein